MASNQEEPKITETILEEEPEVEIIKSECDVSKKDNKPKNTDTPTPTDNGESGIEQVANEQKLNNFETPKDEGEFGIKQVVKQENSKNSKTSKDEAKSKIKKISKPKQTPDLSQEELELGIKQVTNQMSELLKQLKSNVALSAVQEGKPKNPNNTKRADVSNSFERTVSVIKKKLDLHPKISYSSQKKGPTEQKFPEKSLTYKEKITKESLREIMKITESKNPKQANSNTNKNRGNNNNTNKNNATNNKPSNNNNNNKNNARPASTTPPPPAPLATKTPPTPRSQSTPPASPSEGSPTWRIDANNNLVVFRSNYSQANNNQGKMGTVSQHSNFSGNSGSSSRKLPGHAGDLETLQDVVNQAIRTRKTFTIHGNFESIRRALLSRGWLEKLAATITNPTMKKLSNLSTYELVKGIYDREIGTMCRRLITSRMLKNHHVDFIWDYSENVFKEASANKPVIINRFKRGILSYTSKQGLCELVKRAYWFQNPGKSNMRHPRSYSLASTGDPKEFVNDFKITAAVSLLKWVVESGKSNQMRVISNSGKVPMAIFEFAIDECTKYIKKARHEDIDYVIVEATDYEWSHFLECFYKVVHLCNHFKSNNKDTTKTLMQKAQFMIDKVREYCPCIDVDGYMNLWILKPINGSRGMGIHMCRTLDYILQVLKSHGSVHYIIQKYIERPLLIYCTKFDIRQWFLISSACPLTVWIYRECYLRFSSQTFNLRKLHESIHLTNNAVQCKYAQSDSRDAALPSYNMWDVKQFKNYLSNIGYPDVYDKTIYPGMKECIISAIMMQRENIDARKNSFELYGADFLITEDFKPWLIEINARPALYASTPITGRMCPQVLEDTIKVVIDHARNYKAGTGRFTLLYRQNIPKLPSVDANALHLEGKPLPHNYFYIPKPQRGGGQDEGGAGKTYDHDTGREEEDKDVRQSKRPGEPHVQRKRNADTDQYRGAGIDAGAPAVTIALQTRDQRKKAGEESARHQLQGGIDGNGVRNAAQGCRQSERGGPGKRRANEYVHGHPARDFGKSDLLGRRRRLERSKSP